MNTRMDYVFSFRLLAQALTGVLIGVLFSMLLVHMFVPKCSQDLVVQNGVLLPGFDVCAKFPEKSFFLLALLFGSIGGYLTTSRLYGMNVILALLLLAASIPLVNYMAERILQPLHHHLYPVSTLCIIMIASVAYFVFAKKNAKEITPIAFKPAAKPFRWQTYLLLLAVISIVLLPESFTSIAAHVGMEAHVVSFLIGPALYFSGSHLIPGIDYFTQYSLGMGWFFSFLLGNNVQETFMNYMYLAVFATWLFYAQLLYVLYWLYRSWVPAAIVSLLSLILLFVMNVHFLAPSSTVLRYPLLVMCAWLLGRWADQPGSLTRQLSLAVAIAMSIFLNTETGIIVAVAVSVSYLLSAQRTAAIFLPFAKLVSLSFVMLFAILLAIFGTGILQVNFVQYIVEPLLIYAKTGYGNYLIYWTMLDYNWFYNIVSPGVAIATLVLVAQSARAPAADRPRLAVLAFFSLCGYLMMFKYINRSIVGVWQMSALGLLIPVVWWGYALKGLLKNKKYNKLSIYGHKFHLSALTGIILVFSALWLGLLSGDSRNPTTYGFQSWLTYPSMVTSYFRGPKWCYSFDCVTHQPSAKDVALIVDRTRPGEQVAIIDDYDWTYLVNARRAPLMFFVPSTMTFIQRLLDESTSRVQDAPYLFLPKGKKNEPVINGPLKEILMPTFAKNYVFDGQGDTLVAWRRVNTTVNK